MTQETKWTKQEAAGQAWTCDWLLVVGEIFVKYKNEVLNHKNTNLYMMLLQPLSRFNYFC